MSEKEKCGDYEIYEESGWWVVKNTQTGVLLGKFLSKDDALNKVAAFFQENIDEEDEEGESGSVC